MPGYLAGTPGVNSRQSRHIAAWVAGHELLIALIVLGVVAAFILVLALPVFGGWAFDAYSSGLDRSAKGIFVAGFGVLIVGLASGVRIIEIIGGALMAAIVVGIIVEKYLLPHLPGLRPSAHDRRSHPAQPGRLRPDRRRVQRAPDQTGAPGQAGRPGQPGPVAV